MEAERAAWQEQREKNQARVEATIVGTVSVFQAESRRNWGTLPKLRRYDGLGEGEEAAAAAARKRGLA